MSVHYKFKSALDYDTVTFDGLHISVKDLKKAILQQKKIGKTSDFDLQVTNAQTKETYTDENVLIPKNASLIIARVPLTQQQRKQLEKEKVAAGAKPGDSIEQGALGQVDISSLDLSEEEKIKTMMSQSTSDYDPSNYVKVRGGNQIGTVPASYICFKCHQHGHWIKDCPSTVDSANMGMTDTIKRSTGIPRSFMIEVEGPQVPGARMTPSGVFAVPAIDHEVYKEKKIEKPPFLTEKEKSTPTTSIPEDLICGICKDLLQDAVMIPCCGISFCDECIRNVLVDSEESECPDCNEKNVSPDTMIPNRFLRNSVNTFKNKTGYVKVKPKLIQQRPPSPPRPSLPDFVPPPDYIDTTSGKNQSGAKADSKPSPLSQGSPAIQTQPSPSQKTPIYGEISPFNENSNSSLPEGDNSRSFYPKYSSHGSNPPVSHHRQGPYGPGPYSNSRYPGPIAHSGPYPRYSQPPPNFTGHFSQPYNYSTLKPVQGQNEPMHEEWNREGKDPSKEIINQTSTKGEGDVKESGQCSAIEQTTPKDQTVEAKEVADKEAEKAEKENIKLEKLKKAGIDIDDVSSVSSNASEEPPPPDENRRLIEGQPDPSQGPSYAIPSLFSGQHPVILPPPGSDPYPPPRPGDSFAHGPNERSGTPTVDERLEVPPVRAPYDAYRPPNYMMPGYDQHYGMPPHPMPMPYDASLMYDRGYRGMSRGPRIHRGRYAMRQPPPPGSRPLTPPRDEEEAYIAFQRMLKEKEEREKRKNEKMKSRRTTSRSRSRSAARSRRSFSGARSRSRTRSRTPPRRSRSRSKKRSRSRSRSFVMSRSRSRSYSRSPLHERNYSPKKYYSPHRSPLRFDRYESGYGQWGPDHRDYRRGRYRGRGRGRFYKSPPRGHEHQPYNRYRDENYVATPPRHYRSPSRYYDQRMSPRCSDYPRDSREREYRSYERDTESAARERNLRRRSHSNSLLRNQFDTERERDREKDRHREREADRDNEFRPRSRSRRSRSRRYSAETKLSQERCDRSKEKSPERRKDWDREKEGRHKSREPKAHENKDKRKYSRERDYERDREREKERDRDRDRDRERDREKKRGRTRSRSRGKSRHDKDRSRSKDKKKRSASREKQKESEIASKKRRSGSRRRSISRVKEERQSRTPDDRHRKRSTSVAKEKEKRSSSRHREELERSTSREKNKDQNKVPSPKVGDKEDDDKKERKKDKEKKKKKKEKETDEERAARKKKKKEKKEEKKRKQEMKISEPKTKTQGHEDMEEQNTEAKNGVNVSGGENSNFVSSFKAVESKEETFKSTDNLNMNPTGELNQTVKVHENYPESEEEPKKNLKSVVEANDLGDDNEKAVAVKSDAFSDDGVLEDDNVELQIHASYESLLDEPGESQKKGILAPLPEISKWELEDGQVTDSNPKTSSSDAKSPEFPAKVTREVIKRAENAIFKKAVNAIRETPKKIFEKEEKKDRKIVLNTEKDRAKEYTKDTDGDKGKRIFLTREKDKYHHSHIEINKPKTEVKRTINSLQITIPTNNNSGGNEREFLVDEDDTKTKSSVVQRKVKNSSKSPPAGRVPVKERLGSKIEKQGRRPSPHLVRTVEKRSRNIDEEEVKPSKKEYQRPIISSTIESIDSKRSSIDEAHFVPNYDESSDEEENSKSRPSHEKEFKSNGGSGETKKRSRSSSESSEESTKKHKKKRSKSKKKKQKRSKKHMSDSSDSSDSEREKKKHKKSKKKKKSKH